MRVHLIVNGANTGGTTRHEPTDNRGRNPQNTQRRAHTERAGTSTWGRGGTRWRAVVSHFLYVLRSQPIRANALPRRIIRRRARPCAGLHSSWAACDLHECVAAPQTWRRARPCATHNNGLPGLRGHWDQADSHECVAAPLHMASGATVRTASRHPSAVRAALPPSPALPPLISGSPHRSFAGPLEISISRRGVYNI